MGWVSGEGCDRSSLRSILLDEGCRDGTAELAAAGHCHCSIHLRLLRFAADARVISQVDGAGLKPARSCGSYAVSVLQLGVGEDKVERGDCLADVLRFGGTDDRRGDTGPAGHPGECDLRSGDLPLGGDAGNLLDDHPITGSVKVAAEFV